MTGMRAKVLPKTPFEAYVHQQGSLLMARYARFQARNHCVWWALIHELADQPSLGSHAGEEVLSQCRPRSCGTRNR